MRLIEQPAPFHQSNYILNVRGTGHGLHQGFHLTEREEICIMEKEVHDLSYVQICRKYGFSPEMVKTTRKRAFAKMVDAIEYRKEKRRG